MFRVVRLRAVGLGVRGSALMSFFSVPLLPTFLLKLSTLALIVGSLVAALANIVVATATSKALNPKFYKP